MWSCLHSSPSDAVEIFKDVQAKRALGIHWGSYSISPSAIEADTDGSRCNAGTWVLTTEPVMEPPEKLKEACQKAGLEEGAFGICGLGETRMF
jgi:N-acyl-phosphatidylethanolamine-hydrolysing phospholipase D